MLGALIAAAILGLVLGALARLALPGPDPLTLFQTMLVGLGGSVLATLVVSLITGGTYGAGLTAGFACSVAIMYIIRRRRGGGLLDPGRPGRR